MRRWLTKPLGLIFALIVAVSVGVALSPVERPHPAIAQGVGPAQMVQNQGTCSGITGTMFAFFFSASPLHYTHTFDRNGNLGLCSPGAFYGSGAGLFNIPASAIVGGGTTVVSPGPNITIAGTPTNPVVTLGSPTPTTLPSACAGWDLNNLLQTYTCPTVPTALPSPNFTAGSANCTVTNLFPASVTIGCSSSGGIAAILGSANITVGPGVSPVVSLVSPGATTLPGLASCAGWSTITGGSLQIYSCPPSPYPTPIPTSANANCAFAGYTLTCVTPTPAPVPTSANANCAFAAYVLTCTTPTPFPLPSQTAEVIMSLPSALASAGETSFPVPINPYWTNVKSFGSALVCAGAGSGGSASTWIVLLQPAANLGGALITAIPTTYALAAVGDPANMVTNAATSFATATTQPGGYWVGKIQSQSTTAMSGPCTITVFFSHG